MNVLCWFLTLYPGSLWALEAVVRRLADDKDAVSFIGPTIATAALGLLAPVCLPKANTGFNGRERDRTVCAIGFLFTLFGIAGWVFCLALNMKHDLVTGLPEVLTVERLQVAVALVMYIAGAYMTLVKEDV